MRDREQIVGRTLIWLPAAFTIPLLLEKLHTLRALAAAAVAATTPAPHPLTPREQEVHRLIAAGLTNPQIAERLCVSESTVKTHVAEIKRKLGRATRAELVAAYHRTTGRLALANH